MNNYKPNEYEQEIDLIDLFWKLLEKWKMIIALALVGAVLVGARTYVKDAANVNKKMAQLISTETSLDEKVQTLCELTVSERQYAELVVKKAKDCTSKKYDTEDLSQLNNMVKALSTQQKSYYNTLFEADDIESAKQEIVNQAIQDLKVQLSAKNILLGFVLGAFVGCAFIGMKYIFSNRLLNADEMKNRFGGILFGSMEVKNRSNRKKDIGTPEEQLENIVTRVELYCKQNNISKLALISSAINAMNQEYVNSIIEKVNAAGVELINLGNVHENADKLRECIALGKAIVMEGVGTSKYQEIENLIVTANEYKIDLLGSIVL